MKIIKLLFLLGVITFQFSCSKNEKIVESVESTLTVKHNNGNLEVSFVKDAQNPSLLDLIDEDKEADFLTMVNSHFKLKSGKYAKLLNFRIDKSGEHSYLIFEGYDPASKKTSSFAYEINVNNSGSQANFINSEMTFGSAIVTEGAHKCTGDPCSCCAFTKNSKGAIIGCKCNGILFDSDCPFHTSQFCSHEISTAELVPAWGQCGGIGYTGFTTCALGYVCQVMTPYYSQCIPQ